MRKQCIRKRRIIIPRIISTVFDIIIHKFSQLKGFLSCIITRNSEGDLYQQQTKLPQGMSESLQHQESINDQFWSHDTVWCYNSSIVVSVILLKIECITNKELTLFVNIYFSNFTIVKW